MLTDALARDLAPSTVGGLDSEETAALGIAITAEESWSRGAARRATTHETLTVLCQIDSGPSPVDSDTRSSASHPKQECRWSSHSPERLGAHQRSSTTHDWRPT